jgi:hypothetical protein
MDCIFGIFDVLGFTSFCENCEAVEAEKVLKIMDEFESEIPKLFMSAMDPRETAPPEKRQIVIDRLRWLTFSDTIFVAMPISPSDKPDALKFNMIFFMLLTSYISRRMFEIGLPMRGAIHTGNVTVSKRCFAGKAIVEAHRLSLRAKAAVTIVSNEAYALILRAIPAGTGFYDMFAGLIVECDVSTGAGTSESFKTLCWFYLQMGMIEPFNVHRDLRRFVEEKFSAHGKRLSGEQERHKAAATEKIFTEWKIGEVLRAAEMSSRARQH